MKGKHLMCLFAVSLMVAGLSACKQEERPVSAKDSQQTTEETRTSQTVGETGKVPETETDSEKEIVDTTEQTQIQESQKDENNGGNTMLEKYQIEIFCPEELAKRRGDVTYPEINKTSYYSTTCEKNRNVNIMLPANYSTDKKYPVMYVLHGIFGDENSMKDTSVAIRNTISGGLAQEMIVVYPYMYASKTQDVCTAIDEANSKAYDNFVNDLVNDLMPFMAENYSVAEGKENTAVVGFSMGGRESLAIGLQRPDLFGYVGAIAPAPGLVPGKDWAMQHPGQFEEKDVVFHEEKPYVLMVCCGDSDKTVGQFPKSYHELFDKNGVEHVWWEIPGSDHGDPAITSGIYNFVKNIFKGQE